MTKLASVQVTQPRMMTQLPIKLNETHTTTKIHGETIPTMILATSPQDLPSPSKFGKIHQHGTSQFNSYIGGTYLVITHEVPHPPKQEIGSCSHNPE